MIQIFYVFLVLFSLSFNIQFSGIVVFFGILVAVTSVLSGLAYVYIGSIKATRLSEDGLNS